MGVSTAYPVQLDLDAPLKMARWRPLVHWLLAIPQLAVVWILQFVLGVLALVSWFAILFTGNIPQGIFDFMAMIIRYQWRVYTYLFWTREPYPPFEFTASNLDPGTDPARLSIAYPERLSRGLIFVKWLLVIPHLIVLMFLFIGVYVVMIIGWFAVLITGRWPEGMRNFVIGAMRWSFRTSVYLYLMTDQYPPFSLEP